MGNAEQRCPTLSPLDLISNDTLLADSRKNYSDIVEEMGDHYSHVQHHLYCGYERAAWIQNDVWDSGAVWDHVGHALDMTMKVNDQSWVHPEACRSI